MSDKQRTYGPALRTRLELMGIRFIDGDASGEGAGDGEKPNDDSKGGKPDYTPPASQADLDRIIADRVSRERAKYADYDDVKAKAAEHDKLVDAQKTEAEKAAERLAAAEKRAAELEAKATRAEVAAAKGVPAELLAGSTQEELEASADSLIKFKSDTTNRMVVAGEGKSPSKQASTEEEFVKNLFGQGD